MSSLSHYRKKAATLLTDYRHAVRRVKEETISLQQAQEAVTLSEEVRSVVQTVTEAIQNKAHEKIAGVVSKCLKAVFGDDAYDFQINFRQVRGRTEADLCFVRDGNVLEDPLDESGGGCVDVAALALRLACLVLSRPKRRRLLVLDEPLKNLSSQYQELVPEMLLTLAKELKVQIIFSTNFSHYKCGKVIDLDEEKC